MSDVEEARYSRNEKLQVSDKMIAKRSKHRKGKAWGAWRSTGSLL